MSTNVIRRVTTATPSPSQPKASTANPEAIALRSSAAAARWSGERTVPVAPMLAHHERGGLLRWRLTLRRLRCAFRARRPGLLEAWSGNRMDGSARGRSRRMLSAPFPAAAPSRTGDAPARPAFDYVLSPGEWAVPDGVRPGWNWLPHLLGAQPELRSMPRWVRVWYRTPLIDRYAHEWMWWHQGWSVLTPAQDPPPAGPNVREPLPPRPTAPQVQRPRSSRPCPPSR